MNLEGKPDLSRKQRKRVETLVGGLETPAESLLQQISPEIERGNYDPIIGIDASGRIPALVLAGVIKRRYEELGYSDPSTLFVAGGIDLSNEKRAEKQEKMGEYIRTLVERGVIHKDKKVLVVEDTALSALSVRILTDALLAQEVPFEVAIYAAMKEKEELEEIIGTEVHSNWRIGDTSVTHKPDLSGVVKEHDEIFARRRESGRGNAVMRETRVEVEAVAQRLYKSYVAQLTKE